MIMRLIDCEAGHVHVIGPCPWCYHAQGGLLLGTVVNSYKGRVHTVCMECSETVDYYIDAKEVKLWKLESVDTKGTPSSSPKIKAKEPERSALQPIAREPEKTDTHLMAKEPERTAAQFIAKEAERSVLQPIAREPEKTVPQFIAKEPEKASPEIIAKEAEKTISQIIAKEAEKAAAEVSREISMFA